MKVLLQKILAYLARKIINRYHPLIIGITGSVGKTSTREAIFSVVNQKFHTRQSEKNFNNEFGLPFTIIGIQAPGRNALIWLAGIVKGLELLFFKGKYPEVLVLEMGIDRPGDMDYLLSIAKPSIAVITTIGISHFEHFPEAGSYEMEKSKIARSLNASDMLILNADNVRALAQKNISKAQLLTYGIGAEADIKISNITEKLNTPVGTVFKAVVQNKELTISLKTLGQAHVSAAAAALAVGYTLGIEPDLLSRGLKDYKATPGRLNVIAGIKKTILIDDTYNSAPESVKTALQLLEKFPLPHKIAVLGDMLELGNLSEQAHAEIGALTAKLGLSKLVTIGRGGKLIAEGARTAGFPAEQISSFETATQSLPVLQNILQPATVILIKGSQGMRMERITKEIMAEPMRAEELLCRQYGKWLTR